jgi:predicted deoxyguanosinetriphosphate triphosphohydrolase
MEPYRFKLPTTRAHPHGSEPENYFTRTPFERDYDKIIFSNAFARLHGKTQVVVQPEDDHTNNRAMHSHQVADVARSIVHILIEVGIFAKDQQEDLKTIVQTASLAHDIGTPPLGHDGEKAFCQWWSIFRKNFSDELATSSPSNAKIHEFDFYEANAMGFRMLVEMGVTDSTLIAYTKYPISIGFRCPGVPFKAKNGVLVEDLPILQKAWASVVGDPQTPRRHLLADIVDAADDICNFIIDVKDAYRVGAIEFDFFVEHYEMVFLRIKNYLLVQQSTNGPAIEISLKMKTFIEKEGQIFQLKFKDKRETISDSLKHFQSITMRLLTMFSAYRIACVGAERLMTGDRRNETVSPNYLLPSDYKEPYYNHKSFLFRTCKGISAIHKLMTLFVTATMCNSREPVGITSKSKQFLCEQTFTHSKVYRLLPESIRNSLNFKFYSEISFRDWIYEIVMAISFYIFGMTDRYMLNLAESISV